MQKIEQKQSVMPRKAGVAITLPKQEPRRFLAMPDQPFRSNARLKKAMNTAAFYEAYRAGRITVCVFNLT